MGSYEWDSTYSFTVTSQALDEGTDNQWYLEEAGNKWGGLYWYRRLSD